MKDIYAEVTDRFIKALEEGVVPWHQPWLSQKDCNPKTGTTYRGINTLLLTLAKMGAAKESKSYDNLWSTFNGWRALGGHVLAGEKASHVVYWDRKQRKTGEVNDKGEPEVKTFMLLKEYAVFNLAQTEGVTLPKKYIVEDKDVSVVEGEAYAHAIIEAMPLAPRYQVDDHAYYMPALDFVGLPERETFDSPAHFWATKFHETVHSTGHESRVGREFGKGFGNEQYTKEELIAEIGAAFMLAEVGMLEDTFDNNAAYVVGWLKRLKEDPKLIIQASSAAQKAVEYINPPVVEVKQEVAA